MKKILTFIMCTFFMGAIGLGQAVDSSHDVTFEKVEVEASFPGGMNAWKKHLQTTLNAAIPADNGAPAGTFMVLVEFIVEKDGSISEMKPLTNFGFGMEKEVMRVILLSPKWTPALQDGREVRAYRKQPITFVVIEEGKKKRRRG